MSETRNWKKKWRFTIDRIISTADTMSLNNLRTNLLASQRRHTRRPKKQLYPVRELPTQWVTSHLPQALQIHYIISIYKHRADSLTQAWQHCVSGSLISVIRAIKWRSSLATEDSNEMNGIQYTQSFGFYTPFIFPEYCATNPLKQKQERNYEYV